MIGVDWKITAFYRLAKYEVIRNEDGTFWDLNFTLNSGRTFIVTNMLAIITINWGVVPTCINTGGVFCVLVLLRQTYRHRQLLPLWGGNLRNKISKNIMYFQQIENLWLWGPWCEPRGIPFNLSFYFLKSTFTCSNSETSLGMCAVWFKIKIWWIDGLTHNGENHNHKIKNVPSDSKVVVSEGDQFQHTLSGEQDNEHQIYPV